MKKMMKIVSTMGAYLYILATSVSASAWQTESYEASDSNANEIISKISDFIKPIAAIAVFASVLIIGFEIIAKRNKADDRMASMTSLMWVGIGTLVIAFAALVASLLFGSVE